MSRLAPAAAIACALSACGDDDQIDRLERNARLNPEQLDFGERETNVLHALPVQLSYLGGEGLTITVVRFEPNHGVFDARTVAGDNPLRGSILSSDKPIDFNVRFRTTEVGSFDTTMIIEFAKTEARLPIKATAREREPAKARLSQSAIVFSAIEVGRLASQPFQITNDGESAGSIRVLDSRSPFAITGPSGTSIPGAQLTTGQTEQLDARFEPTAPGTFSQTIELVLGGGPPASLTLSGEAVPAGTLSCTPTSVPFGDVPRGATQSMMVSCTVFGGVYTLQSFSLSPATTPFRVPAPPPIGVQTQAIDFSVELAADGLASTYSAVIALESATGVITAIPVSASVVPPMPASTDLSVALTWNTGGTDFDLHLTRGGATPFAPSNDCYFDFKNPDWGQPGESLDDPFLDVDTTTGFGPEQINLSRADGTYDIYVQYFNYRDSPNDPNDVTVTYWLNGAPTMVGRTMSMCGSTWHVGTVVFTGGNATFTGSNEERRDWASRTRRCR